MEGFQMHSSAYAETARIVKFYLMLSKTPILNHYSGSVPSFIVVSVSPMKSLWAKWGP